MQFLMLHETAGLTPAFVAVKKDGPHDLCGGTDHAACVAWSEVKLFGGLLEFSLRLSCYMT